MKFNYKEEDIRLHKLINTNYELIEEPILTKDKLNRLVFKPTSEKESPVMHFYKLQERGYWVVEEIRMNRDKEDWDNLSTSEQNLLKYILAFFACADGIIIENVGVNFIDEIKDSLIRMYYTKQLSIESVHAETYTMLLDYFITDIKEKESLFDSVNNTNAISKKAAWAIQWMDNENTTFDIRLIAFSIVEGIFFSGCFCIIYWFKNKGILHGLAQSNELISRDEGIHTDFACMLHNKYIKNKTHHKIIDIMMKEAIDIEFEFIDEMFKSNHVGISAATMKEYIKFISNRHMINLGYDPLYDNVSNPFPFMENISVDGKTNFFENEVTEYTNKTGMVDTIDINMDADI